MLINFWPGSACAGLIVSLGKSIRAKSGIFGRGLNLNTGKISNEQSFIDCNNKNYEDDF